jgi:hypothetical protein
MSTVNIRQINGVVRTSEPVWSNLERLAEAASVWFTYDTHNGVYAWVINEAGDTVQSITEADIIGPIQISGSGLNNLYNSAEIEYPRSDLNDQPHYATVNLPDSLRNQYEPDNKLQITSEFINNQPQAEYVAMVTLKQSRLDRTVTIVMDYSKINLQAGDIIDITSDTYGWISKEFRIMRVREIEGDDGSLRLEFSCTEYDDTIYDGTWDNFLVGGAPGIRAIGAIGQPATPTIAITTINSLPAQAVTTTVPAGVVDRVQFWAGNVLITGNVANTDFNLVGSLASTDAASFTAGANVTFTTTSLADGTWAWKSRGTNGGGTGPFSDVSANVEYVRGQAPDLIIEGTPVVNITGVPVFPVIAMDWNGSIFDGVFYTGNSVYQPVIGTTDVFMLGVKGSIANVAASLPPGATTLIIDTSTSAVVSRDNIEIITGNATANIGIAVYLSTAVWDQTEYNANGFAGLNWTDWVWQDSIKDQDRLLGNAALMTVAGVSSYDLSALASTHVYALGYSTTIVPNHPADFTLQVDPISGITGATFVVPFVGNTVIGDATGLDTAVFQYPGKTGNITVVSAAKLTQAKIRIEK